jgi:DNA-directed RNA polymerase subunit RPC12/RpoP
MTYRFECRCGKKLEADDKDLGEEIRCPQCGARVLLPFKPEGTHGYVEREKLARPALILSLLPIVLILYAAIETAVCGQLSIQKTVFNLIGIVLWLGQIVTVVLGAIALRRIKLADKAGNLLEGEKEATVAVVLGSVWLALFARFLLFYLLHV